MKKNTGKKLLAFLLAALMLLSTATVALAAKPADGKNEGKGTLQEISESLNHRSYASYMEMYEGVERGNATVTVKGTDYDRDSTTAEVEVKSSYQDSDGSVVLVGDSGLITWTVNIPKEGMYAVGIDYCSVSDKTNSIERVFYINGAVPFAEARYLLLKKVWISEYTDGRFLVDGNGNELRPKSYVSHQWQNYTLIDSNGYYSNPFEFYFKEGENTISLESVREEMAIKSITIFPYEENISYEEYVAGKTEADAEPIKLNAETPSATSDYTIYPIYDRKSAITQPQDASRIMLNTIGSEKWVTSGQWIEYTFTPEVSGLYEIVTRFRQDELAGMYTSRKLYINGQIPFEEANYLKFEYTTDWKVQAIGKDGESYQFYFEAGKEYTIRFEVTLGEMGDVVRLVDEILASMNNDYLEILKLTGPDPDDYRDYGFRRVLPDVVDDLLEQSFSLQQVINYIEGMANIKTQNSATLEQLQILLRKMGTDEGQIAKNLEALKSGVGTLGDWINTVSSQPLELDWIHIQPASAEKGKAEAGFFEALWYELRQFFASFTTDYNSLGNEHDGETVAPAKNVDVWVSSGRDQAQIIRNLIDNDFYTQTGLNATLKLVAGGTLLPSVLAGVGPDVALPGTGADPIQYAIRSAVLAVNPEAYEDEEGDDAATLAYNAEMREIFSDFDEVAARFTEAALTPITLYGAVYGLPDTQTWDMMFYRTDILANLGLEVPETWDELLAMIPVLQFNNMEIGLSQNYTMYLYQMGGDLWADDGMRINLDSNKALEAFETMCNMFTQYSLPQTYDAANRFRTGEVPIMIQQYTVYNNIVIFGTELAGLWDFGPIPGFEQEDGTIDNTSMSTTTALVMMSGVDDVEATWEFMKWYTDKKFQVDYSNELVALLGPAAKNATANMEALEELPWTSSEYKQLMKQMENTAAVVQYPGAYIIERYTNFAFLDAYNNHADPVESLLGYINAINKEISRKRIEFNLETLEVGQTLASKRLGEAAELIDELDDNRKSTPVIKAALEAIANESIEELEAVVTDLTDAGYTDIAGKLTEAAKALRSYIN